MFHRVKSENQNSFQNQPQQTAAQKPAVANRQNYGYSDPSYAGQSSREQTSQTAAQSSTSETPTSEKEQASMNNPYQSGSTESETAEQQTSTRSLDIPGSMYQRTPAAPRSYGSGYPGVYAQATNPSGSSSDRRLTIGRGITLSGEIESCDYLMVEGTVEAALKGANVLEIAESGVFYGTVEINEATIAGRFEGDITVSGRLTVRAGGSINGTISYKELEVEAGGTIEGRITPAGGAGEAKKPQAARKQTAAPARPKSGGQQQSSQGHYPLTGSQQREATQSQAASSAAMAEGELFSSSEEAA